MNLRIYKLKFKTPVHFGTKRLDDNNFCLESDTIYNAIFSEAIKMGFDTDFLLNNIVISSGFPYVEDTFFLPKPMIRIENKDLDLTNYKLFKKLKFIPVDMYHSYVNGECNSLDVEEFINWLEIGDSEVQTKVALESKEAIENKNSEPYNIGVHKFNDNSGIYFMVRCDDKYFDNLDKILESLQYSGLGGKKSFGLGRFEFEIYNDEEITNLINGYGDNKIVLSISMTDEEEELNNILKDAKYLLKKRSCFIEEEHTRNFKKNAIYGFVPGSVFKTKFTGKVFLVGEKANHPVYRNMKAFWLEV